MADLIDRQELLKDIESCVVFSGRPGRVSAESRGANKVIDRIEAAHAVDAVEVVRCKDCKDGGSCEAESIMREIDKIADPYCAAGKRREENAAD